MKRNIWIEVISSLFILLFTYTAISKFIDFFNFKHVLLQSPLIGKLGARIIAWALPLTEIVVSLVLFFPRTRKLGLWASLILMTIFTGYLAYMLYMSDVRPCSCGGVLRQMTWNQHFVFNIFFTLLAITGLLLYKRQSFGAKVRMSFEP